MSDEIPTHCETFVQFQHRGFLVEPPEKIEFQELARGRTCVLITLNGEIYRLQLTRNQKLILTK